MYIVIVNGMLSVFSCMIFVLGSIVMIQTNSSLSARVDHIHITVTCQMTGKKPFCRHQAFQLQQALNKNESNELESDSFKWNYTYLYEFQSGNKIWIFFVLLVSTVAPYAIDLLP